MSKNKTDGQLLIGLIEIAVRALSDRAQNETDDALAFAALEDTARLAAYVRDVERELASYRCLSRPIGLHCAPADGQAVHPHSDHTWWFWDETWCDEIGPYSSKTDADAAVNLYGQSL